MDAIPETGASPSPARRGKPRSIVVRSSELGHDDRWNLVEPEPESLYRDE